MSDSSLFAGLAGAGLSAATGNWVGAAIGLAGTAVSAFGSLSQASATSAAAQQSQMISGQINQEENSVNSQHQQAMMLSASRQNMEGLRQAQQARAQGLAAGVS